MTAHPESIRHVKKGEYIINQGDNGEVAYLIESGRIEISIEDKNGEKKITTQGPESLFGELALLAQTPRAASVRAIEDCCLIPITREDFQRRLEAADPILKLLTNNLIDYSRRLLLKNMDMTPSLIQHKPINDSAVELDSNETAKGLISSMKLEHALNKALNNNELILHYQPIINLKTQKTAGFEALMRWNHPTEGMISPSIFIPVAEDTGLIVKLSEWALRESTAALKRIGSLDGAPDNLYMSINFSSHDLSKPSFLDELDQAVTSTNLNPGQVKIEITERLLILQPEVAAKTLKDCRDAGFSIAIDDFGTGYSSLSYLQDFPIDTLKIDQAFVRKMIHDTTSEELVRTIIHLGKTLGMDIIAEGAETQEEVEKLIALDCDMVQGFYFSKAMEESSIKECFRTWPIAQ